MRVGAGALAVAIGFAGNLRVVLGPWSAEAAATKPWTLFMMAQATLTFGGSAAEALSCHGKLRRRLAIGLADPVTANRFLLWGSAGAASALGSMVNGFLTLTTPLSALHPVALVVSGSCGALSAVVMVRTFLPPAGYLRFVEARHAAQTG